MLQIVRQTVVSAQDMKAQDIVAIDVRGRVSYCDFFVVCTGTSNRQVSAIADHMIREVKKLDVRPLGVEGKQTARWVLIDLGDVLVHVFEAADRGYYDLDGLWMDAPRLSLDDLTSQPPVTEDVAHAPAS